ncbi:MAG TPA: ROK family protein [Ilumatobacteraceae bacterium]|nr:ROK family protein [Ilumatobacteraceae bacterium]HRB01792.1 ROK family protein [Ilumatobacteraceae bacterium]
MLLVAGVDVGGTNIEVGLVDDGHTVRERAKHDTPAQSPHKIVSTIVKLIEGLDGVPSAIGIGIPGVVHNGRVLEAPNLAGWDESFDIVGEIRHRFGVPVALGNDANVGLLGEWVAGAAVGADDVLGVWMGTGIGGGLILDGRPFVGSRGSAGEIGHVVIRAGGALCTCGRRGCIEAYAGRRSMEAAVTKMVAAGRHTSLFEIQQQEEKSTLTSKVWARALDEGDELAVELFDAAVEAVAVGIGSAINLVDVQLVVIGGGMAEKLGQDLVDRIERAARPWILHPSPKLKFVVAALGDDSGIVGAASIGRARLLDV